MALYHGHHQLGAPKAYQWPLHWQAKSAGYIRIPAMDYRDSNLDCDDDFPWACENCFQVLKIIEERSCNQSRMQGISSHHPHNHHNHHASFLKSSMKQVICFGGSIPHSKYESLLGGPARWSWLWLSSLETLFLLLLPLERACATTSSVEVLWTFINFL